MDQLNWDLDYLLQGKTIDDLFNEWKKQLDKVTKIYDTFIESKENFKKWIIEGDKLTRLSNRLSNYISNKANEEITNQTWISWSQKLSNISNEFSIKVSNYNNIIIKNSDLVYEYLKDDDIKDYKISFDEIIRYKPHTLDETSEKLLAKLSKCDGGVNEMYDSIIDAEIKYDDAIDSKNKKHKIENMSQIFINLKSSDRKLRESSWISFNKAFYDFKGTLTHSLYYTYLTFNTHSKIANFKDYIDSCCFDDEIERSLLTHIYNEVKKYKNSYKNYQDHKTKLLKQKLNIAKIEPWDASIDLTNNKIKIEPEEAKKIVIETLKIMGDEYLSVINRAFEERWISWLPKKNKATGAYSIGGTKGLDRFYILMNYDKTLNSVYTLIHELGHSLNSYYYSIGQKIYQSTSIFCAEVASITNEMLLNYFLLKKYKNNKMMKLQILDELISGFYATTTRQVIFSNFEYVANEIINNDMPFVYETVESNYLNIMNEYMHIKDLKKYKKEPYKYSLVTPLRIPHFYAGNFYVYKYAIGQIVAVICAKKINDGDKEFLNRYFEFLKSGTSKSPLETIKILGIDLTKKDPWEFAIKVINEFTDEFKKINIK